jgi:hypothetical protein
MKYIIRGKQQTIWSMRDYRILHAIQEQTVLKGNIHKQL